MSERLEIRPGGEVFGADGLIGHVGRVIVSPASREVTALELTRPLLPAIVLPIEAVKVGGPVGRADRSHRGRYRHPPRLVGRRLRRPTGRLAVAHRPPRRARAPASAATSRPGPPRTGAGRSARGGGRRDAGQGRAGGGPPPRAARIAKDVLLDSASRRVTHFVMRPEALDEREVIVPVEWIDGVMRDRITLHMGEEQLDRLPVYRSDEQITDAALDVLWYRSDVSAEDLRHVDVLTREGIVVLSGYARTDRASSVIESLVRGLDGVLGVRNKLTSFDTLAQASSRAAERRPM